MKKHDINFLKNNWNFKVGILNSKSMFKAAVLIPLCEIDNETYIIFEKRSQNIIQANEVCFPGGKYEDNDIIFSNTAIRETSEELGIPAKNITILEELDTFFTPFNSVIYSFLGFIDITDFNNFKINENEVQNLIFVPINWLLDTEPEKYKIFLESHPHTYNEMGEKIHTFPAKDLGLPSIYHNSWSNGSREVYSYAYKNEIIWGFTALILKNFLDKYKEILRK